MASVTYGSFTKKLMEGVFNLSSDTIKCALVTSSYTPDMDTHDFFNDVTNEITGTGYTAGGATLASKTVTYDSTDNEGVFDAANPTWASSTLTARGAVIYKDTGSAATSPLIRYIDFGTNQMSNASTFTVVFDAEGIINLTIV
jgi:hypothetical protein